MLSLPRLFSDHMVLQQQQEIMVWGSLAANGMVTVHFLDQTVEAVSRNGKWCVTLAPMPAGGPYTMTITAADCSIVLRDVYIGEVWVCGGQSNMEWQLNSSEYGESEAGQANYPQIRFFRQSVQAAEQPVESVQGEWFPCTREYAGSCSAVAYYFARRLQEWLGVPIGLLQTAVGGTAAQYWMSRRSLQEDPDFSGYLQMRRPDDGLTASEWLRRPTVLYNGMIAPIQRYAVRGALWYQGERNANIYNPIEYRKLFPALIADWRRGWRRHDLPFLFVQLPGYGKGVKWPLLREAQLMTALSVPHTEMAVTIDTGDETDIHPLRKQPVGERLALLAGNAIYGKSLDSRSPLYCGARFEEGYAIVRFTHAGSGLAEPEDGLRGFEICGADGVFREAQAKVEGTDTVVVWHESVQQPRAVRYGWGSRPVCNLYSYAKLPASPFRSDSDVICTDGERT